MTTTSSLGLSPKDDTTLSVVMISLAAGDSAHVSVCSSTLAYHSLLGLQNHTSSDEQLMHPLTSEISSILA